PFTRMIRIDLKHLDVNICKQAADRLAFLLRTSLEERVLGPEQPLVSRVRNFYIQRITLKVERKGISMEKVKQLLRQTIQQFAIEKSYKSVRIQIDVDPY